MAVCVTAGLTLIFSQDVLRVTNSQKEPLNEPNNELIEVDAPYQVASNTKLENAGTTSALLQENSSEQNDKIALPESSDQIVQRIEIGTFISADRVKGVLSQEMELEPQHLGEFIPLAPPE